LDEQVTMFQPELEALDPEALARLQRERMRKTLARVAANPAWSRRLGGVRPEDLARVEDWGRLPFLTKD
jgi:phenylacetate-coenzyme A ligase PaaK-like adenylate-forming protein